MQAFLDNLRLAFGTFLGNPLRSLLTLLGIVIGVMTAITIASSLTGLRQNIVASVPMASTSPFITASMPANIAMPRTPTMKAWTGI